VERFRQPLLPGRVVLTVFSFSVEEHMGADALQVEVTGERKGRRGRSGRRMLMLAALAMPLLLGACASMGFQGKAAPSDVHYYYDDIFNTYDLDMRITPSGAVTLVERRGAKEGDIRRMTGQLSQDQLNGIWADFADWQKLQPFYSSDVTLLIQITYNGKMVQTSSPERAPDQFRKAKTDLEKVVASLLRNPPATAPATTNP